MARKLPPFAAICAFEAVARHLSFKCAAEELHVTPSAVSHQVRRLEAFLQAKLFHRRPKGIVLTDVGRRYLPTASSALDQLDSLTFAARRSGQAVALGVQTTPAFAARWLAPKVGAFARQHPDIALRITTSLKAPNFENDGVDFLVRYGLETMPGLIVEPLLWSGRSPVCSPELLRDGAPLRQPVDLRHHALLVDMIDDAWDDWFVRAGCKCLAGRTGSTFEHCELTLCAAENGQGVALAHVALIERELASGVLVKPFDIETRPHVIYAMGYPERWADRYQVSAFRAWLMSQIGLAQDGQGNDSVTKAA